MEKESKEAVVAIPINELAVALASAQAEFPIVETNKETSYATRKGGSTTFKWADLGQLRKTIGPVLAKHGLCVLQDVESGKGWVSVVTTVIHGSGAKLVGKPFKLACPGDDPKTVGAHVTYACRYDYTSFLSVPIADEIDIDQHGVKEAKEEIKEPKALPPKPRVAADPILPQEQAHLFDLLAGSSWSAEELKQEMIQVYSKASSKDLTLGEYSELCDMLLARRKRIVLAYEEYDGLIETLVAKKRRAISKEENDEAPVETEIIPVVEDQYQAEA